ncbi:hypothetical protein Bca52824_036423 [Brassica carinata]|uniref:Uncharacterized protein n=1 Tax=Brassica carinata TaxID=52824 RepID=A0A8X7S5H7_BRACI|nr:hypothetical protein Bca52824_036423 [Brassica carinata]
MPDRNRRTNGPCGDCEARCGAKHSRVTVMRMVRVFAPTIVELVECRLFTTGQGVRIVCAKQIAISFTIVESWTSMVTLKVSIAMCEFKSPECF